MSTADYALIVSISSAFIAVASLIWNVCQKYIFVKPQVQVGFGVYHIMEPTDSPDTVKLGRELLQLSVTNMGPGPVIIHGVIGRKRRWAWRWKRRFQHGYLSPIHGDPRSNTPVGIGPFGGRLPAKLDAGEVKSFYFPYTKDGFLKDGLNRVGAVDTYSRNSWCRRCDMKRVNANFRETFLNEEAQRRGAVDRRRSSTP
jgi:hypothetical protein